MTAPPLLTILQVAKRLQVTTRTVKRYMQTGALASIDIHVSDGRPTVRVGEAQLATFLRKRTRRGKP